MNPSCLFSHSRDHKAKRSEAKRPARPCEAKGPHALAPSKEATAESRDPSRTFEEKNEETTKGRQAKATSAPVSTRGQAPDGAPPEGYVSFRQRMKKGAQPYDGVPGDVIVL